MPRIIDICPRLLAAAVMFTDRDGRHPSYRGVHIEHAEGGGLLITATNGHIVFHGHDRTAPRPADDTLPATVIFPKAPPASFRKAAAVRIDMGNLTASDGKGGIVSVEIQDIAFPDYTRIFPRIDPGAAFAQFDPNYLATLAKVAAILHPDARNPGLHIEHNGPNAARVTFSGTPHAMAVIAPRRIEPQTIDIARREVARPTA